MSFMRHWKNVTYEDMHVTTYLLFTTPTCAACKTMKAQLQSEGKKYEEISLDTPEKIADFKSEFPHVRTVPFVLTKR